MAMQIQGNQEYTRMDYAERVKEKQAAERAEKAEEKEEISEKPSEPQDEYISSEKSGKKPSGLYWVGQGENGSRKIFYEDPKAAKEGEGDKEPKAAEDSPERPAEICVGNTDKADREIKKLKEKKKELEQQIQSASGDEKKIQELEKKLAQVEQELSQKDNDTYRREHSVFSSAM